MTIYAADSERAKKKREFLMRPIFRANRSTSQQEESPSSSTSTSTSTSTNEHPGREPIGRAPQPKVNFVPGVPKAATGADTGTCGRNTFLGSYCLYQLTEKEWLLCTEKWGDCAKRTAAGCFAPETRLLLSDGSLRKANRLRVGDSLWDPHLLRGREIRRVVVGPEEKPLVVIRFPQSHRPPLKVTTKHPISTTNGVKTAQNLRPWDLVETEAGTFEPIEISQQRLPSGVAVWNFELEGDDTDGETLVVAEGIVTGAMALQRRLEAKPSGALP